MDGDAVASSGNFSNAMLRNRQFAILISGWIQLEDTGGLKCLDCGQESSRTTI